MTVIQTANPPERNIIPSFGASDNSGNQSFCLYNGGQSQGKKPGHFNIKGFSEGSVPVETWETYADLAGLMNAISLLQTKRAFLKMALKSIHGLKKIFNESEKQVETELSEPDQSARFSELSSFVIGVLNRTGQESANNGDQKISKGIESQNDTQLPPSRLAPKFQSHQGLDQSFKLIQERLDIMETEKAHLLKLALEARLKIEKFNKTENTLLPQKVNEATNETLQQFGRQSVKSIVSQTIRLSRKALNLINN
jgi:hypothetical protein